MRYIGLVVLTAVLVALAGATGEAQVPEDPTADPQAERAARDALEAFITRWNSGDDRELRQAMHFPFVTLAPGGALAIASEPDDFSAGFDGLRSGEGWRRSSFDFDSYTVRRSSPNKVHLEIDFARYGADGSAYSQSRVFYIVTREDGRWALKLRGRAAPPEPLSDIERTRIVEEARQTVLDFFTAFNAGDAQGTVDTLNHPHLFMTADGGFSVVQTTAGGPRPNFTQMRQRENWHMSTIDALEASVVTPDRVHFEITFTRWHPDGTRYWTVPAVWIVTRSGEDWGIQVRSLMPATFDDR